MTPPEAAPTALLATGTAITPKANHFARLTSEEARRALYIDFEGGKDQAPVLLGTLGHAGRSLEPFVHQVVVDPIFTPAGPAGRNFHQAFMTLAHRAERHDRRIVAWSEHELKVVQRDCAGESQLVDRFERRYCNARRVAERWMNKLHAADKPPSGQLSGYLTVVGYDVPGGAEPGHVGTTIKAMRPRLEAGLPLTPVQKAKWSRLLEHNRHDCAGMRRVCLKAARELERAEASPRTAS